MRVVSILTLFALVLLIMFVVAVCDGHDTIPMWDSPLNR